MENANVGQIESPLTTKIINFTSESDIIQVNLSPEEDLVKIDASESTTISTNLTGSDSIQDNLRDNGKNKSIQTTVTLKYVSYYYKPFEVWSVGLLSFYLEYPKLHFCIKINISKRQGHKYRTF